MIRNFKYLIVFTSAPGVLPEQSTGYCIMITRGRILPVRLRLTYKNQTLRSYLIRHTAQISPCATSVLRCRNFTIDAQAADACHKIFQQWSEAEYHKTIFRKWEQRWRKRVEHQCRYFEKE